MEIDPSKQALQPGQQTPGAKQPQGDGSAFTQALERAKGAASGEGASAVQGAASGQSAQQLVGALRHQAVQAEQGGQMQKAMDLMASLSSDFAHGRSPDTTQLQRAEDTLAGMESRASGDERAQIRDVRSSVSFYLGRMEREQGGA